MAQQEGGGGEVEANERRGVGAPRARPGVPDTAQPPDSAKAHKKQGAPNAVDSVARMSTRVSWRGSAIHTR